MRPRQSVGPLLLGPQSCQSCQRPQWMKASYPAEAPLCRCLGSASALPRLFGPLSSVSVSESLPAAPRRASHAAGATSRKRCAPGRRRISRRRSEQRSRCLASPCSGWPFFWHFHFRVQDELKGALIVADSMSAPLKRIAARPACLRLSIRDEDVMCRWKITSGSLPGKLWPKWRARCRKGTLHMP